MFITPAPVEIEFDDTVSTVQDVMEVAADNNSLYQFTATFFNRSTGYVIDAVSGIPVREDCLWLLYYQAPEEMEPLFQRDARISYFRVEANSTVVLSYRDLPPIPLSPSPTPTPTPTPGDDGNAASIATPTLLALAFCLFLAKALQL